MTSTYKPMTTLREVRQWAERQGFSMLNENMRWRDTVIKGYFLVYNTRRITPTLRAWDFIATANALRKWHEENPT